MCDHNGHMNVKYYYQLFDDVYTKMYIENLGFDNDYLASGFSTFTLEDSIRYLREFKLNDNIYPSFYLYKVNKKLLHFVGVLLNEQIGNWRSLCTRISYSRNVGQSRRYLILSYST